MQKKTLDPLRDLLCTCLIVMSLSPGFRNPLFAGTNKTFIYGQNNNSEYLFGALNVSGSSTDHN